MLLLEPRYRGWGAQEFDNVLMQHGQSIWFHVSITLYTISAVSASLQLVQLPTRVFGVNKTDWSWSEGKQSCSLTSAVTSSSSHQAQRFFKIMQKLSPLELCWLFSRLWYKIILKKCLKKHDFNFFFRLMLTSSFKTPEEEDYLLNFSSRHFYIWQVKIAKNISCI